MNIQEFKERSKEILSNIEDRKEEYTKLLNQWIEETAEHNIGDKLLYYPLPSSTPIQVEVVGRKVWIDYQIHYIVTPLKRKTKYTASKNNLKIIPEKLV